MRSVDLTLTGQYGRRDSEIHIVDPSPLVVVQVTRRASERFDALEMGDRDRPGRGTTDASTA